MPGLSVARDRLLRLPRRHRLAPFLCSAFSYSTAAFVDCAARHDPVIFVPPLQFASAHQTGFAHLENYRYLLRSSLRPAVLNTFLLVG